LAFAATKKGGDRDVSGGGVDWGKEKCRFGGRAHRGTPTTVCAGRTAGRPYIVVLIVVGVAAALVESAQLRRARRGCAVVHVRGCLSLAQEKAARGRGRCGRRGGGCGGRRAVVG
jgi:hypothetical protein